MTDIGKAARYVREQKGLSLRGAAEKLGITHVHLCNIENGKSTPSIDLLDKLRKTYGVDIATLAWCLYGDPEKLPAAIRGPMKALAAAWRKELGSYLEDAQRANA